MAAIGAVGEGGAEHSAPGDAEEVVTALLGQHRHKYDEDGADTDGRASNRAIACQRMLRALDSDPRGHGRPGARITPESATTVLPLCAAQTETDKHAR